MEELLKFVSHKWNCDYLQPMWHQGPCDCGLHEMLAELTSEQLDKLRTHRKELVDDWEAYEVAKAARKSRDSER